MYCTDFPLHVFKEQNPLFVLLRTSIVKTDRILISNLFFMEHAVWLLSALQSAWTIKPDLSALSLSDSHALA